MIILKMRKYLVEIPLAEIRGNSSTKLFCQINAWLDLFVITANQNLSFPLC
jgi:hypothetical protein